MADLDVAHIVGFIIVNDGVGWELVYSAGELAMHYASFNMAVADMQGRPSADAFTEALRLALEIQKSAADAWAKYNDAVQGGQEGAQASKQLEVALGTMSARLRAFLEGLP